MDIAQHIRIFDKTPTDDFVEKRTTSITTLSQKYESLASVENILQLAADLTTGVAKGGTLSEARIVEVETEIRTPSSSFVREHQELQILTCALLAALKLLAEAPPTTGEWSRRDVLALGLWSGLGFQIPRTEERLEALRSELLLAARTLALASAANARKRQIVPAAAVKMPEAYEAAAVGTAVLKSATSAIDALRLNAALDREEIDLLWWALSGWSKLAKRPFSSMNQTSAAICAGLEAGSMVRRIPVDAHKHLVIRLLKQDQSVKMLDALESVKDEREHLAEFFASNQLLLGRESLFPLVVACIAGKAEGKTARNRESNLSDLGARGLLESSILHLGLLPKHLV